MQYIGFYLNENEYSIPILKVREIIRTPSITKMPQSPHYVEGITNIRGSAISIVNLKKLINANGNSEMGGNVIVISIGKITFGILVDGITGVIHVDESSVEPAERFLTKNVDQVEGVAKLSDRLVILLNTKKLLPLEDVSLFEDFAEVVQEKDSETVEVSKTVNTMGGDIQVRESYNAKEFLVKRGIDADDPKFSIFDDIINFMNALTIQDYEKADTAILHIIKKGQSDLFKEVGTITRKLHDSIKSFREAVDPKLKEMATTEMPNAIDKLQFVIAQTEDAANKTMNIVEKYLLSMDELASHIRGIKGPEESISYLKNLKNCIEDDMTEILTTQSFQDITGQTLKKVIKLVGDIEGELVRLVATFGVKIEQEGKKEEETAQTVSQSDIDDLLKDFGF